MPACRARICAVRMTTSCQTKQGFAVASTDSHVVWIFSE